MPGMRRREFVSLFGGLKNPGYGFANRAEVAGVAVAVRNLPVEARFAAVGDAVARTSGLQKCLDKYVLKWPLLESKAVLAGGACLNTGDLAPIQGAIDAHTTNVATALAGGPLTECSAAQGQRLRTGQTQCWDPAGILISCAGTGHDGAVQAGLVRLYTDNDDGTITDERTGLTWEEDW